MMRRRKVAMLAVWAVLGMPALSASALAQEASVAPALDPARDTSRQASLPAIAGKPSPLPYRLPTARRAARAEACFADAIAYAAKTDSDSLIVWQAGKLLLVRDFAPHDAASRTWSASMAKTVAALALGIAIDEGAIRSVDHPVSDYLDEWKGDARKAITFRHLLEMASGLHHPAGGSAEAMALLAGDDVMAAALRLPADEAPGRTFDYHTVNVTLLIEAIERATGEPFADYIANRLWQPLGAGDALGAGDRSGQMTPAIFASARDWLRIGILMQQKGRWQGRQVVPARWIASMERPSALNPNYGWLTWLGSPPGNARSYGPKVDFRAIHSAPFTATDLVYLDGFGGQRVYISPSRRLVVVRTGAVRFDWDDAIIPNAITGALSGRGCRRLSGL